MEDTNPKQSATLARASSGSAVSSESARAQVLRMFEAFEVDTETTGDDGIKRPDQFIEKLARAVAKGRLEVNGEGDDIKIEQHLRREIGGQTTVVWNWSRLGMGKARVKIGSDGVIPYGQAYTTAAPMIGHEVAEIHKAHPVDLSLIEDIAGFFQKI